jgi:hypothetical protein
MYAGIYLKGAPFEFLKEIYTGVLGDPIDNTPKEYSKANRIAKEWMFDTDWDDCLQFVDALVASRFLPTRSCEAIAHQFETHKLAYRVVNNEVVVTADENHAEALLAAFDEAKEHDFSGAFEHLSASSKFLSGGDWKASVRESIHAVVSACRKISPGKDTFAKALTEFEKIHPLHPTLSQSWKQLYGYSSREQGIRHPIVDEPNSTVDEELAIYMNHVCAAMVRYFINVQQKQV